MDGFVRRTAASSTVDQARGSAESRIENCQFLNSIANGLNNPLPGYPEDCTKHQ
jgi:hypothetical protein